MKHSSQLVVRLIVEGQFRRGLDSLKSKCSTPMAHFLLLSCSFAQLFASVLPSPRELSSPVYSFQLVGKGKPMRAVPAPPELPGLLVLSLPFN